MRSPEVVYRFGDHYHPYTGNFIKQLNRKGIAGFLNIDFQESAELRTDFFPPYEPNRSDGSLKVVAPPVGLDLSENGAYSVYNWELFFHAPLLVATHLSKTQRFEDAQRWFHYVFDPTSNDDIPAPYKFWKFLRFRDSKPVELIDEMLEKLASSSDPELIESVRRVFEDWRSKPFQPHAIARARLSSYQMYVVMAYLDNLIDWGRFPVPAGYDGKYQRSDAGVRSRRQFAWAASAEKPAGRPDSPQNVQTTAPQPGYFRQCAGRTGRGISIQPAYAFDGYRIRRRNREFLGNGPLSVFLHTQNDKLLAYWDTVSDRLYKIRNCLNMEGIFRKLALFDPPIDPGLLVKATAAGIDLNGMADGRTQPTTPARALLLLQKAQEICSEVKALGSAFLSAIEKKEAESLGLLRQAHESNSLRLAQDVRFLQWQETKSNTQALLKSREAVFQRFKQYQALIGRAESETDTYGTITLGNEEISENNFDTVYQAMVGKYVPAITFAKSAPINTGPLALSTQENTDLNVLLPQAHDKKMEAAHMDILATALALIPQFTADGKPLGVGAGTGFGGRQLSSFAGMHAKRMNKEAEDLTYEAGRAAKTAGYQRRLEEWTLQRNLAAGELVQFGQQIISSLIREQSARHEYNNHKVQIENAQAVTEFLQTKFAGQDLYGWMQGELSKTYYDCYKFAVDTARKAEILVKNELMRPELEAMNFIGFDYWDGGKKDCWQEKNSTSISNGWKWPITKTINASTN